MQITATDFINAFRQGWQRAVIPSTGPYPDLAIWENFVIGPSGLLVSIMAQLTSKVPLLTYKREFHRFDVAYVAGQNLFGQGLWNPSEVHVLIEHEMNNDVEKEMWKLIHWRAPLKVLITYDWADTQKTNAFRSNWGVNQATKFRTFLQTINSHHSESPQTEYLFLIAQRPDVDSHVSRWLWSSSLLPQLQVV